MEDNKGFTLIGLLVLIVVIVIAVLVLKPIVSNILLETRKKGFLSDAVEVVKDARQDMQNGEIVTINGGICQNPSPGMATVIKLISSDTEKLSFFLQQGKDKSSFNSKYLEGYIVIYNKGSNNNISNYDYYISLVDSAGNGIDNLVREELLSKDVIKTKESGLRASNNLVISNNTVNVEYNCEIRQ